MCAAITWFTESQCFPWKSCIGVHTDILPLSWRPLGLGAWSSIRPIVGLILHGYERARKWFTSAHMKYI